MHRILVVEDDPAIGCALEDDLRLEGYSVELVTDGESAIVRARADRFDLILLDVMLPKKDASMYAASCVGPASTRASLC